MGIIHQGEAMAGKIERSPSPSEVGISLFTRRQLVVGGSAISLAAVLAACGSDDAASGTTSAAGTAAPSVADTTAPSAAPAPTAVAPPSDLGQVTLGGIYTDDVPNRAINAALETTGLDVKINSVDRDSWVQNFNTYLQQPDDVMGWNAGYRMRAFASKGAVGDVSDVWDVIGADYGEGFKSASTGLDGKQYFVPYTFYPWGIFYRKSLWEEKGYTIPVTWDDFLTLLEKIKGDGLIPIASSNDGGWQQMGWFDMINMRTNGYDFHVSLMGGRESWEDDKVKAVFTNWSTVLPYYQENYAARTWQEAATSLGTKEAAMFLLGSFLVSNFDPKADPDAQAIIDDIDFFAFPEISPEFGQDAVEAPIDGFMKAKAPKNPEGANALLIALGGAATIQAGLAIDSSVIAANSAADTSTYTPLQKKSAEFVSSAKFISQFLDRDTDPDFASNVVGAAFSDWLAGADTDEVLKSVEAQKQTYTFE